MVIFDHEHKRIRISQRAPIIIDKFAELSMTQKQFLMLFIIHRLNFEVKPEYGSYMLELTPIRPYNQYACALNGIEQNMRDRRLAVYEYLGKDEDFL